MKFILASSSPRRRDLLLRLQPPFDIILPNVDESMIVQDGNPETYCTVLAERKANDISQYYPNEMVIGADTIVVLNDHIFGKRTDGKSNWKWTKASLRPCLERYPEDLSDLSRSFVIVPDMEV